MGECEGWGRGVLVGGVGVSVKDGGRGCWWEV